MLVKCIIFYRSFTITVVLCWLQPKKYKSETVHGLVHVIRIIIILYMIIIILNCVVQVLSQVMVFA